MLFDLRFTATMFDTTTVQLGTKDMIRSLRTSRLQAFDTSRSENAELDAMKELQRFSFSNGAPCACGP